MPIVQGRLQEGKPIIEVTLTRFMPQPTALTPQSDFSEMQVRQYRALLDTGADITCICENVVRQMRLQAHTMITMTDGSGTRSRRGFLLNVGILCNGVESEFGSAEQQSLFQLEPVEAAEIQDNRWFDLIVGTDTLQRYEFTLRKGGEFTLNLSP